MKPPPAGLGAGGGVGDGAGGADFAPSLGKLNEALGGGGGGGGGGGAGLVPKLGKLNEAFGGGGGGGGGGAGLAPKLGKLNDAFGGGGGGGGGAGLAPKLKPLLFGVFALAGFLGAPRLPPPSATMGEARQQLSHGARSAGTAPNPCDEPTRDDNSTSKAGIGGIG